MKYKVRVVTVGYVEVEGEYTSKSELKKVADELKPIFAEALEVKEENIESLTVKPAE